MPACTIYHKVLYTELDKGSFSLGRDEFLNYKSQHTDILEATQSICDTRQTALVLKIIIVCFAFLLLNLLSFHHPRVGLVLPVCL